MFFGYDNVALPVILCVDYDLALPVIARINSNLYFGVRINANIEYLSMAGEPGICPAAVVTDADWSNTIDDKKGLIRIYLSEVSTLDNFVTGSIQCLNFFRCQSPSDGSNVLFGLFGGFCTGNG